MTFLVLTGLKERLSLLAPRNKTFLVNYIFMLADYIMAEQEIAS